MLRSIPLVLERANVAQALSLSHRFGIYAYDAYYLEVAGRLRLPLLTLDQQMKSIGQSLDIQLMVIY